MASWPGPRLEDFIKDLYNVDLGDHLPRMVTVYEPIREMVEYWLDEFDNHQMSWRDFRNDVICDRIPQSIDAQAEKIAERCLNKNANLHTGYEIVSH